MGALIMVVWFGLGCAGFAHWWPDGGFYWYEWKAWLLLIFTLAPFGIMCWAIGREPTHPRV